MLIGCFGAVLLMLIGCFEAILLMLIACFGVVLRGVQEQQPASRATDVVAQPTW
jgi:uncharacterized membrane protein